MSKPYQPDWIRPTREEIMEEAIAKLKRDCKKLRSRIEQHKDIGGGE